MCGGGGGYRPPPPPPAPPPAPPPEPVAQPAKLARGRRRTQASATFSSPRQAASQKAGVMTGTLLSQDNLGGNTLLGA
jgi:hypothetical protein